MSFLSLPECFAFIGTHEDETRANAGTQNETGGRYGRRSEERGSVRPYLIINIISRDFGWTIDEEISSISQRQWYEIPLYTSSPSSFFSSPPLPC